MTAPPNAVQPDIDGAIALLATSPDEQVRQWTAYLLGQAGGRRAVEPLIAALDDAHVGVRGAAANALGMLGDARAMAPLRRLLDANHPQLSVWLAFALTRLGDDQFARITDSLTSTDVDVRRSAVLALRQLGDVRAIVPLLARYGDTGRRFPDDNTVAEAAAGALAALGHPVDW